MTKIVIIELPRYRQYILLDDGKPFYVRDEGVLVRWDDSPEVQAMAKEMASSHPGVRSIIEKDHKNNVQNNSK